MLADNLADVTSLQVAQLFFLGGIFVVLVLILVAIREKR